MKNQTAVQWLFRQMTSTWYDTNSAKDILKQAIEMEKQQMIEFAETVPIKTGVTQKGQYFVQFDVEKYYNQIYTDGTI